MLAISGRAAAPEQAVARMPTQEWLRRKDQRETCRAGHDEISLAVLYVCPFTPLSLFGGERRLVNVFTYDGPVAVTLSGEAASEFGDLFAKILRPSRAAALSRHGRHGTCRRGRG